MPFFSDVAVRNALPGANDLPPETLEQIASDAILVYEYVHRQPGASDAKLRKWGEGKNIGPDRMNAALGLLRAHHKVFELPALPDMAELPKRPSPARRKSQSRKS